MIRLVIILVLAHALPVLGIFMEDGNGCDYWYKYPYIFGSYVVGILFFLYQLKRNLSRNEKEGQG